MKSEKKQQVKGTVLFTVVCVMTLLVLFIMGTLVLAASANNRAHKSYSSSQTNYTARAAVDSILAAIGDPSAEGVAFANAVNALSNVGDELNVDVQMGNSSLGRIDNTTITLINDGDYPVYDSENMEWVSCDRLLITTDVTLGGETTTMTTYILKDAPVPPGGGGNPAGFMTRGDFSGGNHTSAFGGTYIGVGFSWATKPDSSIYPYLDALSDADKDNYLVNKQYSVGNGNAMEAPLFIDGGLYSNVPVDVVIPKKGLGITIWGDMEFQNNSLNISSVNLTNADSYEFNEVPYLYVDGKIKCGDTSLFLGDGTFPLNVFCGSIYGSTANFDVRGDVYCMDSYETTELRGNNNLYSWTASVVKGGVAGASFGGNFYSRGNLLISKDTVFEGDVCVEGDVEINSKTNIKGNLVVGGNLKINSDLTVGGNIFAQTAQGEKVTVGTTSMKAGYSATEYSAVLCKNVQYEVNPYYSKSVYAWMKADAVADWATYPEVTETLWVNEGGVNEEKEFVMRDFQNNVGYSYSAPDASTIISYSDMFSNLEPKADMKYNVYTDGGGNIVDESEAVIMADMSYDGITISPAADYISLNKSIYPTYANKKVLLGLDKLEKSGGDYYETSETQVVKTVYQMMTELGTDENLEQKIKIDETVKADVDTNVYDTAAKLNALKNGDGIVEITDHCTITGSISASDLTDSTIIFKPEANGTLWVKLKDLSFSNGAKFIVDDESTNGQVKFFVEGVVSFNGSGSRIITKKYDEIFKNNQEIWVTTDNSQIPIPNAKKSFEAPIPNIYIYSSDDMNPTVDGAGNIIIEPVNKLIISNEYLMTAYIEAPFLLFEGGDFGTISNDVYYNNAKLSNYSTTGRANFGCVICQLGSFTNDWTNIFIPNTVTPGGGGGGAGLGNHTYQAVDYYAY